MTGPIVVTLVAVIGGAVAGGVAGAAAGLLIAIGLVAAVVAGAAVWAQQIGRLLESEDAFANAPRPPGFGPLCDLVYERVMREPPA